MRSARRDHLVAAAQVAYHFPAYKFDEALDLGRAQRELLLAVALAEEERQMERWERALGLTWDMESLINMTMPGASSKKDANGVAKVPSKISIPALVAMAPEMLKEISNTYRRKYKPIVERFKDVPQGNTLVEVGNLSAKDARAFFKRMAVEAAQAPSPPEGTE